MSNQHFLWGVSTSGYQSEGGFNDIGCPHNNWAASEVRGDVMKTGRASDFWQRYSEDFERCQGLGLNAFRMSIEWARVQPTTHIHSDEFPKFDLQALDDYAARIASCKQHGLEPVITLQHFTHPAWLGVDAWLDPKTVDKFTLYVRQAVLHINKLLVDRYELTPINWYITVNEPNILANNTYLSGQFPSEARGGINTVWQAYSNLLIAHIRAYNIIHDIYTLEGWSSPQVTLNTYCSDVYWSEKAIWDLLSHRSLGIAERSLHDWLKQRAQQFTRDINRAGLLKRPQLSAWLAPLTREASNRVYSASLDADPFAPIASELAESARPCVFDYVALDYYDPFIFHAVRLPRFGDSEFAAKDLRSLLMNGMGTKWWDWRSLPKGLYFFCKYYAAEYESPILIAENGMALRRKPDNSIAKPRGDRLRRSDFLTAHVEQVQRLVDDKIPLLGYMHWSLLDNYEWGSFTPRFGLYTIDYKRGTERLAQDHLGDRPSETYARLIRQFQA
ncbi:MAG: family 1 glycosylhydrolase [Cyanobacteria bacterium J06597_1]